MFDLCLKDFIQLIFCELQTFFIQNKDSLSICFVLDKICSPDNKW